ncbi:MAG: sensor histidine kinase [Candidatus Limnocylindria bacterium]
MADGPVATADASASEADRRLLRRTRLSLALWSGGVTLAVLLVLGVVLYAAVARSLDAAGTALLVDRAEEIRRLPADPADEVPLGGFLLGGRGSGTYAIVADANGRALLGRGPGQDRVPDGLPLAAGIAAARDGTRRDVRTALIGTAGDRVPVRVLTDEVTFRGRTLYLQIVGDRTAEVRTLAALVVVLVVGGLVALLVAIGAGAAYASRALVPVRRSLEAQRAALRRQREFAADASHELRTPLAVIRASVDDLERHRDAPVATVGAALADIRAEVDQLTTLVDDLLLLARSDSGALALERQPLDLGDVASTAASALSALATERGVTLAIDPEPADVVGDPARSRQLVVILVDNAIRHARPGGTVTVAVRRDRADAVLTVEDDGPGIRTDDLPRLFDRFYRGAAAPGGGTGLGLAIAASIVAAHGGTIAAANRPEGGARFSVRIPLAG